MLLFSLTGVASGRNEKLRGPASWIDRSNQNSRALGCAIARFEPESAAELGGVAGFDDKVCDLGPHFEERMQETLRDVQDRLQVQLTKEKDPKVRADLEILVSVARRRPADSQWRIQHALPHQDVAQVVFQGLDTLLGGGGSILTDTQAANAVSRLQQYVGSATAYSKSISEMAEERLRETLDRPELTAPLKAKVQRDISNTPELIAGIEKLVRDRKLPGCEEALALLHAQLTKYS